MFTTVDFQRVLPKEVSKMFGEILDSKHHIVPYLNGNAKDRDMVQRVLQAREKCRPSITTGLLERLSNITKQICTSSTTMRRRLHSRRSCVLLLSTCLCTVFFYHLLISSLGGLKRDRRDDSNFPSARYFTYAMQGGINESSNFTQQLWLFKSSDAERIYLYTQLLRDHVWRKNEEGLRSLRKELLVNSNVTIERDLIMTQQNVKVGEEIPCYIVTKKFWQNTFVVKKEFYSSLPKKSPIVRKMYQKCAVVGNSGSMNDSKCGPEIDSMDYVFRCNVAPIGQYREDAGRKTDFITFNPSILHKEFGGLKNDSLIESYVQYMKQYNSVVWYPCFGARPLVNPCIHAVSYDDRVASKLVIGNPLHYINVWNFWKRRGLEKKPSTGLYLVNLAITMCEEIHLYGFWPFPVVFRSGTYSEVPYHYFNKIPFTTHHSTDTEFRILLQLHMLGVVRMHSGTCAL